MVGSYSRKIYVLNNNGSLRWSYRTGRDVWTSPAVADIDKDGRDELAFGSSDGNLYVLKDDGSLLWKINIRKETYTPQSCNSRYRWRR